MEVSGKSCSIDNRLIMASVKKWQKLSHPLEWNQSEGAQQVHLAGKLAIVLEDSLYFSIGWISENLVPQSMPVAQSISIGDCYFSAPLIFSIFSDSSNTVELIAKYRISRQGM